MSMLTVKCNVPCGVLINNLWAGEGEISLPLPDGICYVGICPLVSDMLPAWCVLEKHGDSFRPLPDGFSLLLWQNDILELCVVLRACGASIPPVISCESSWNNTLLGSCGEYIVLEGPSFSPRYYRLGEYAEKITALSGSFALVQTGTRALVFDNTLTPVLERPIFSCSVEANTFTVFERLGALMDFQLKTVFDKNTLTAQSSALIYSKNEPFCTTPHDAARFLCEAVRLSLQEQVFSRLTPSLAAEMTLNSLNGFLGTFCEICDVQYLTSSTPCALALKYAVQKNIYKCTCYEFVTEKIGDEFYIDDIREL